MEVFYRNITFFIGPWFPARHVWWHTLVPWPSALPFRSPSCGISAKSMKILTCEDGRPHVSQPMNYGFLYQNRERERERKKNVFVYAYVQYFFITNQLIIVQFLLLFFVANGFRKRFLGHHLFSHPNGSDFWLNDSKIRDQLGYGADQRFLFLLCTTTFMVTPVPILNTQWTMEIQYPMTNQLVTHTRW